MEPTVAGDLDLVYVNEALARAGTSFRAEELKSAPLTGGRTAAAVTRLQARGANGEQRDFVLKAVPAPAWRRALGTDASEARLWLSGTTRALPAGIRCPTLDVAKHAERDEWWLLMEDVSSGIVPRGTFDEAKAHTLMRALARMHARHWGKDDELARIPLGSFDKTANALAAVSLHVARKSRPEPWLEQLSEDFWVPRVLLPVLLNALSTSDADFFVSLCADHERIAAALLEHPRTLCHGDLRRANIAFVGDDVALFDWEFASCGPAARDLEWYRFLQFWAYPANDDAAPETRNDLIDTYVEALDVARGQKLERAAFDESCELGWLSVLCQIGFCLADALTGDSPPPAAVARAKRVSAQAIDRARRIYDRHVR